MEAIATERTSRGEWKKGFILEGKSTRYTYCAKVYGIGSIHGINEGRVSKLEIIRVAGSGKTHVFNYDRGEDIAATEATQHLVDAVLKLYPCEEVKVSA